MGSPADIAPFSAYFPLATRYSLDVPALFNEFGLGKSGRNLTTTLKTSHG